jgi:hypothetical protein
LSTYTFTSIVALVQLQVTYSQRLCCSLSACLPGLLSFTPVGGHAKGKFGSSLRVLASLFGSHRLPPKPSFPSSQRCTGSHEDSRKLTLHRTSLFISRCLSKAQCYCCSHVSSYPVSPFLVARCSYSFLTLHKSLMKCCP